MLRSWCFAGVGLCVASSAYGRKLNTYYDVTGVAKGDVLFVREKPNPKAKVVGKLAPTATAVLWVGGNQRLGKQTWREISFGEGIRGWVNNKYLRETPLATGFDFSVICTGTEPFWELSVRGNRLRFSQMGDGSAKLKVRWAKASSGRTDTFAIEAGASDAKRAHLIFKENTKCSDEATERNFRFEAHFVYRDTLYSGCCNPRP